MDKIPVGIPTHCEASVDNAVEQSGRDRDRYPIHCVMQFVPIDGTGKVLLKRNVEVVGKDLSATGISFSHAEPIPHRRGVLVYNHSKLGRIIMEVEMAWTKVQPTSLRESGCRLIRNLTPEQLDVEPPCSGPAMA